MLPFAGVTGGTSADGDQRIFFAQWMNQKTGRTERAACRIRYVSYFHRCPGDPGGCDPGRCTG